MLTRDNPEGCEACIVAMTAPKLLSPVARGDLAKIVQRVINKKQKLSIYQLWRRYRGRIKGSLSQYGATVSYLIRTDQVRFKRYHR